MVSMTLSVPEELKREMEEFPELNWSEVARGAIKRKVELLKRFREFTADSEITSEDAMKWGAEVSKKAWKRHQK